MQNSNGTLKDIILWLSVGLLTVAAFLGTYTFHFTTPIIAMIWIVWLIVTFGLAFFTQKGQSAFSFAKEAKLELEKVIWPDRQETTQTTLIVMTMVTVTGFVLWGIDSAMMWAIGKLTHLS